MSDVIIRLTAFFESTNCIYSKYGRGSIIPTSCDDGHTLKILEKCDE